MSIVQHSSEHAEHYTPAWLVEAARDVLGGIDLDPASNRIANQVVRARKIYTARTNGFDKVWEGRVFLNPPGGLCDGHGNPVLRRKTEKGVVVRESCTVTGECGLEPGHSHFNVTSSARMWWGRMAAQHRLLQGFFVGFSLELLQSTQSLDTRHLLDFPVCIPRSRIQFDVLRGGKRVAGTQPTHANVLALVAPPGVTWKRFKERFQDLHIGRVFFPGELTR